MSQYHPALYLYTEYLQGKLFSLKKKSLHAIYCNVNVNGEGGGGGGGGSKDHLPK